MGHKIRIIADEVLKAGCYVSGANKPHYHAKGIKAEREFTPEWADIHEAREGDRCPKCDKPLHIERVIEIGNIFKLGTKYSVPLKAVYLDEHGKEKPMIMGSYGIGPARIAAAAVEQSHDDSGIIWPKSIAPFAAVILPLNAHDDKSNEIANKIYKSLLGENVDILIDDRVERAGIKFKDAELIGIPVQVIIGERNLKEGFVEIKDRSTGEAKKVRIENTVDTVLGYIK
jgi:prolyl-tRNA synthetase